MGGLFSLPNSKYGRSVRSRGTDRRRRFDPKDLLFKRRGPLVP